MTYLIQIRALYDNTMARKMTRTSSEFSKLGNFKKSPKIWQNNNFFQKFVSYSLFNVEDKIKLWWRDLKWPISSFLSSHKCHSHSDFVSDITSATSHWWLISSDIMILMIDFRWKWITGVIMILIQDSKWQCHQNHFRQNHSKLFRLNTKTNPF